MAAAAKLLTAPDVVFAQCAHLARLQTGWRPEALVFTAHLDDAALASLIAIAPNAADLRDAAFPGATLRRDFLQRRALTRSLLAMRLGIAVRDVEIAYEPGGSPQISRPFGAGHVSIASRDRMVAIALADQPVGIDLEPVAHLTEPVWDVLHADEQARLRACDVARRPDLFLRIWTAKEAGLKAFGSGLRLDPAQICTNFDDAGAFSLRMADRLFAVGQQVRIESTAVAVAFLAA